MQIEVLSHPWAFLSLLVLQLPSRVIHVNIAFELITHKLISDKDSKDTVHVDTVSKNA